MSSTRGRNENLGRPKTGFPKLDNGLTKLAAKIAHEEHEKERKVRDAKRNKKSGIRGYSDRGKLSNQQILDMRAAHEFNNESRAYLATKYKVSEDYVRRTCGYITKNGLIPRRRDYPQYDNKY